MEAAISAKIYALRQERERQAIDARRTYPHAVVAAEGASGTMLYWLKRAAKELRAEAGRKQVHVAASMDADQSTVWRFENDEGWPRNPDVFIAAYADDLGVTAFDIWSHALELWEADGHVATVQELRAGAGEVASAVEQMGKDFQGADARRSAQRSRASRRKRAAG